MYCPVFDLFFLHILGHKPVVQCAPIENSTYLNTSDVTRNVRVEYKECGVVIYRNVTNGTTLRQEIPCPAGYQYDIPRDRSLVTEVLTVAIDHGHLFVAIKRSFFLFLHHIYFVKFKKF